MCQASSLIFTKTIIVGDILIQLYNHEFAHLQQLLANSPSIDISELKSKIINASRFLAECYRYHILEASFFSDMIRTFLPKDSSQTSEHSEFTLIQIESIGVIATIVGRSIESGGGKNQQPDTNQVIHSAIQDGFQLIQSLSENRNVRPQTRYMLKSLIELKNNRWVLPVSNNNHSATVPVDSESSEIVSFAENVGKTINKFLSAHTGEGEQPLFWRKLLSSLSCSNYDIFKETVIEDRAASPSSTPVVPLSPWLRRATIRSPQSPVYNNNNLDTTTSSKNPHGIQKLNLTDLQFPPMDIDDNFSLNNNNNNNDQQPSFQKVLLRNLDSGLPDGFISPKLPRSESSPHLGGESIANLQSHGYRESPEFSMLPSESNLSVLISIIDSKIVGPRDIWKRKIMNKVMEMRTIFKKTNKTEIMAAIWQNMCDNQDDYVSYLDLCLTLVQMDEEEANMLAREQELALQPAATAMVAEPSSSASSEMAIEHPKKKSVTSRRCSMATVQMSATKQANLVTARRSSIAFPAELTRRGSMSEDSPNICPPAPKLKSTPTLKSTSHKPPPAAVPIVNVVPSNKPSNNNNNSISTQPTKKHKSSNSDSFKDVLVESLQDDLALKMFVKKRSLIVYFELLKDLYREFIIEIPLLLKCISLIQQGLYELSDKECMTLFELEEMAQQQQNVENQILQRDSLVRNQNQFFQWKTNTWQEKPARVVFAELNE
eukprot:gene8037-9441_t